MSYTLLFKEPASGWIDRTNIVWLEKGISFGLSKGQRGPLQLTLAVPESMDYAPDTGWPVYLSQTVAGVETRVFAGTIENFSSEWVSSEGFRAYALTVVTLEQTIDTICCEPQIFVNENWGTIITTLLGQYPALPFALGMVSAGITKAGLILTRANKLSDVIALGATECGFVFGIDPAPATPEFYFRAPSAVVAPFTFTKSELLWLTNKRKISRADFRDRQTIQISFAAFQPTTDVFNGDGHTVSFDTRYPVDHVVSSVLTTNAIAKATGIFTGQPLPGDTVEIDSLVYTFVTTLDNREFGQVKIAGTTAGTCQNLVHAINLTPGQEKSAYSLPTWENSLCNAEAPVGTQFVLYAKVPGAAANGIPLADHATNFSWYSGSSTSGPPPTPPPPDPSNPTVAAVGKFSRKPIDGETFQTNGQTYTFVLALNNAAPNQILIDLGRGEVVVANHTIDAINGNPLTAGISYSSATVANPDFTAGNMVLVTVPSGVGYVQEPRFNLYAVTTATTMLAPLVGGSNAFAFDEAVPPVGGTNDTSQVATNEQANAGTGDQKIDVQWSAGSTIINAQTAVPAGVQLAVSYYRIGADCITVEDTNLVAARAIAENGTGRVDMVVQDTQNVMPFDALSKAKAILEQYGVFPKEFSFETNRPGLLPGQFLTVSLTAPTGAGAVFDGDWLIQDVEATLVAGARENPSDPFSEGDFFHFTVTAISATHIPNYVQFYERLAQTGGSGIGATGPAISRSPAGGEGGSGGGGGDLRPVEEVPIGPIDGRNTIYTLTWVPMEFPLPTHQWLALERNGVLQSPFSEGSPSVGPWYTISQNVITYTKPLNPGDTHVARYFAGVGVPTPGNIRPGAIINVVTLMTKSPSSGAQHAVATGVFSPLGGGSPVLSGGGSGSSGWDERTDSATWSFGGGTLPDLSGVTFSLQFGYSLLSLGPPDAFLQLHDIYLDFVYDNLDPSLAPITKRYRPTTVVRTDDGSQCNITHIATAPPTAEYDCFHTSGLSSQGNLVFGGWALSQQF